MQRTQKLSMWAMIVSGILTGGLYWYWSTLPWWVYGLFFLFAAGTLYEQWLKIAADETIINRDGEK